MAEAGLRYNRFHVTALCSPTRAALLTGRNNHFVGFGSIGEFSVGFPGYSATLPRDCAPLPRILRDNGYSTSAYGKWHLTPDGQQGPAGPFDRWPNGWGFDYFYGFLAGGSGQWDPCLTENQKVIGTPDDFYDEENPHYFPDAMADSAIEWLHGMRAQDADKPFFMYFSTGCSHAPHHVHQAWAEKYKGQFDQGWDRCREETFARQKALGVVPPDAELTPRAEAFPAWDDLSDELKAFYEEDLPTGDVSVRLEFAADGATPATGGEVTLFIDDRPVGKGRMDHTVPVRFSGYAGMDIGRDNGGVVDLAYEDKKPFAFTGTVKKVVFDIQPHLSDQDELDLHAEAHRGHAAGSLAG
jgi:hypothetical protein